MLKLKTETRNGKIFGRECFSGCDYYAGKQVLRQSLSILDMVEVDGRNKITILIFCCDKIFRLENLKSNFNNYLIVDYARNQINATVITNYVIVAFSTVS